VAKTYIRSIVTDVLQPNTPHQGDLMLKRLPPGICDGGMIVMMLARAWSMSGAAWSDANAEGLSSSFEGLVMQAERNDP